MSRQELRALCGVIYRGAGEALAGDQLIAQARTITKPMVIPGTSSHRMREVVLKVNALCVIDRPFRLAGDAAFRLKDPTQGG